MPLRAHAIGLGVPFVLVAAFFPQMKRPTAWMNMGGDRKTSGVVIVVIGHRFMSIFFFL
jgi:cytochrome c-type biogenesis protein